MSTPAAVLLNKHICPMVTPGVPPVPHASGGVVVLGAPNVLIGKLPSSRMGDSLICNGPPPHPDTPVKGSATVLIGKKPAARLGDTTGMGGAILQGSATVIIGG